MLKAYRKYKRIILYLIFGGLTTLVNLAVYFCLTRLGDVQYIISNVFAWVAAVLFAYASNRAFVFNSRDRGMAFIIRECFTFIGCRLFSGMIDTGMVWVMIELFNFPDLMVKVIANIVVVILNYVFSRRIVFKDKGQGEVIT